MRNGLVAGLVGVLLVAVAGLGWWGLGYAHRRAVAVELNRVLASWDAARRNGDGTAMLALTSPTARAQLLEEIRRARMDTEAELMARPLEEAFTVLSFRAVFAADELEHLKPEALITAPIWLSRRMEKPLVAYVSGLAGGKAQVELWTEGGGGDWRLVDAGEYFELEGGRWTFDWPRLDRRAVADALRWGDRAGVSAAISHEFGVEVVPLWSGPRRGVDDKQK